MQEWSEEQLKKAVELFDQVLGAGGTPKQALGAVMRLALTLAAQTQDCLIWWLTEEEAKAVAMNPEGLPLHILVAVQYRQGRPSSGRVWATGPNQPDGITVAWGDSALSAHVERCGGIIVPATDVAALADFPGLITTLALERWPAIPGEASCQHPMHDVDCACGHGPVTP